MQCGIVSSGNGRCWRRQLNGAIRVFVLDELLPALTVRFGSMRIDELVSTDVSNVVDDLLNRCDDDDVATARWSTTTRERRVKRNGVANDESTPAAKRSKTRLTTATSTISRVTLDRINGMNRKELRQLCEANGLKVGGTKATVREQLARLLDDGQQRRTTTKAPRPGGSIAQFFTGGGSGGEKRRKSVGSLRGGADDVGAVCEERAAALKRFVVVDEVVTGRRGSSTDESVLPLTTDDMDECLRLDILYAPPTTFSDDV